MRYKTDPAPTGGGVFNEWYFDAVPERELLACCLWEYARESPTIALAADIWWLSVLEAGRHLCSDASSLWADAAMRLRTTLLERRESVTLDLASLENGIRTQPEYRRPILTNLIRYCGSGAIPWTTIVASERRFLACLGPDFEIGKPATRRLADQAPIPSRLRLALERLAMIRWVRAGQPDAFPPCCPTLRPRLLDRARRQERDRREAAILFQHIFPFLPSKEAEALIKADLKSDR